MLMEIDKQSIYLLGYQLSVLNITDVVGISKGGLVPAVTIGNMFNKKVYSIGLTSYQAGVKVGEPICYQDCPSLVNSTVLLVDDIADTGDSLQVAKSLLESRGNKVYTYVMAYKEGKSKVVPDFYDKIVPTDVWIDFPWEK